MQDALNQEEHEANTAFYFYCPKCEKKNFVREVVVVKNQNEIHVQPASKSICKGCKYELSSREVASLEAGGITFNAWVYTCPDCGGDNYIDISIYTLTKKGRSFRPPKKWSCEFCKKEVELAPANPFQHLSKDAET